MGLLTLDDFVPICLDLLTIDSGVSGKPLHLRVWLDHYTFFIEFRPKLEARLGQLYVLL